ncbi:hypothetical protein [Zoogloea sp.]|uniref:hypothetical protein n=1 Tax=Zoogloea sp. TaxID=49181 RepID=UPI0025F6E436|nr:hypothetical protein [Zoogloea sp.]MCK6396057.1 hypothetical protein [Zoogloea sp.]
MIIEINYLTVVIAGAVLSAFAGVLWAVGRTFLQQYGSMLADQLAAHRASEQKVAADIQARLDRMESDQAAKLRAIDLELDALRSSSAKALTHGDLDDLYVKVNATSNSVSKMEGLLSNVNDTLRMILSRIADKGLS